MYMRVIRLLVCFTYTYFYVRYIVYSIYIYNIYVYLLGIHEVASMFVRVRRVTSFSFGICSFECK